MKQLKSAVLLLCILVSVIAVAQTKSGVLTADEVKKIAPSTYYFDGQSAPVQARNTAGLRANGKVVLAGLVDNSGYSSDVQAKYQGLFIAEVKVSVAGKDIAPGQYGFGFSKDGKFFLMDVGNNEIVSAAAEKDDKLARPVPLKIVAEGDSYRLYAGRHWVAIKAQ